MPFSQPRQGLSLAAYQRQQPQVQQVDLLERTPRQKAAELIEAVLDELLTPRQAINRWPSVSHVDESLDVAYQALLHFESDERQQQEEVFYIDVQLALLAQIVHHFKLDQPLPQHILWEYQRDLKTYTSGYYTDEWTFYRPFVSIGQGLGWFKLFWEQLVQLAVQKSGSTASENAFKQENSPNSHFGMQGAVNRRFK